jgi:hypothetical protein
VKKSTEPYGPLKIFYYMTFGKLFSLFDPHCLNAINEGVGIMGHFSSCPYPSKAVFLMISHS